MTLSRCTVTNVLSTLLLLHFAYFSAKKTGDFGMIAVCRNESKYLRIDCWYPNCSGSPPYHCRFLTEQGLVMGSTEPNNFKDPSFENQTRLIVTTEGICRLFLEMPVNNTKYKCVLQRQNNIEIKEISIQNEILKTCSSVGFLIHSGLKQLWITVAPAVVLQVLL